MSATDGFRAAMAQVGLTYAGPIVPDSRLHRFRASEDKERNSWYVLHTGPPMAGAYGCWKRQVKETWCERNGKGYSQAEWDSTRRRWHDAERERERCEVEHQAKARATAAWILQKAKPASAAHPYLTRKGVRPHGDLRQRGDVLVIPLRDLDGTLHSLQFIDSDGNKRFLTGGRVSGCFFPVSDRPEGRHLALCEGVATGLSIHLATNDTVICAMDCHNVPVVAQAIRAKWASCEITICADNDAWTDSNPGLTRATQAAQAIHARLSVPLFANTETKPTDFNDLAALEGLAAVKEQIDKAQVPKETDEEAFIRLAKLSPADYDRCREAEAKRLGIRVTTLDDPVYQRRPTAERESDATEPWPDPVNGTDLLDGLAAEFRRFLVLPPHADTMLALWTLHTYSWEQCEYSPIVAITSPVRSCGKSRVLDVMEKLVCNPFRTGNMSEAVLFRVLDSRKPTVLIDEFDTIPEDRRDAIANILKNGFHCSGKVHRVEGEANKEVVEFIVFGPKALACIKLSTLDAATVSRCINIRMQRKKPGQKVDRLRRYDGTDWQRKCLRWTQDHLQQIESGMAAMPEALGDREQDIYEPLFVLANLAGGTWPEKIRTAALALCGEAIDATQDSSIQLLGAIRCYYLETGQPKVSSSTLVEWLNKKPDAAFGGWNDGQGIRQSDIRRLLAGFNIQPDTIRIGDKTAKGYGVGWFEDAFTAYLPDSPVETSNTVTTPVNIGDSRDLPPVTQGECYRAGNAIPTNKDGHCYHVTGEKPDTAPQAQPTLDFNPETADLV